MSRKVIVYIATSLDGYIARKDGEIDWLLGDGSESQVDNGYKQFFDEVDTVIMGNTTYKQILSWGDYPYKGTKGYVYTTKVGKNTEDVTFTSESPTDLIKRLKSQSGKAIWMVGGAGVLDAFMKEDLIDEYIIAVAPVLIGEGISLFKEKNPEIKLTLKAVKAFDGFVQSHYVRRVAKEEKIIGAL